MPLSAGYPRWLFQLHDSTKRNARPVADSLDVGVKLGLNVGSAENATNGNAILADAHSRHRAAQNVGYPANVIDVFGRLASQHVRAALA